MHPSFQFHHMAIAVRGIAESSRALEACGFVLCPEHPDTTDTRIGVHLRFMRPAAGGPILELVTGIGPKSPVTRILEKSGTSLYHMCFEVPNLAEATHSLRQKGYLAASPVIPATAFGGRPIQFLFHPDAGLIELLEGSVNQ